MSIYSGLKCVDEWIDECLCEGWLIVFVKQWRTEREIVREGRKERVKN